MLSICFVDFRFVVGQSYGKSTRNRSKWCWAVEVQRLIIIMMNDYRCGPKEQHLLTETYNTQWVDWRRLQKNVVIVPPICDVCLCLSVSKPSKSVAEELGHKSGGHSSSAARTADASLAQLRYRLAYRLRRVFHLQTDSIKGPSDDR